ncbi:hypothetical protein [Thermococcus barophilus]|uniref:hypothetical protein n=1 Tax=Thermococcus barophilus TaxID=55802 RepID=UPI00064E6070|nr:hypothetical protein [Thermococcus barophilus]
MESRDFYHKNVKQKHPEDLRTMLLHPFLALTLSHIAKSTSKHVGHAVGDAFDSLVLGGVKYGEMKQNPEKVADEIISAARERGIPVKNEDKEKIITAIQKASKIVDKLTGDVSEEKLDALYQALAEKTDDPLYILKRNGIDIEPELEEFRQFLAEISGRKTETEDLKVRTPKTGIPSEVLAIVKGLEFADFSENAMQKAEKELLELIDGLLDDEKNALWVFYAVKLLRLIQRKDLGGIKKFED